MKNISLSRLLYGVGILVIVGAGVMALITTRILAHAANVRVSLSGQVVPLVAHSTLTGPASPQQQLTLSIGLTPRNQAQLDTLLSNLYDPASPQYHQFLSPAQFRASFAPTDGQVQQVIAFLQRQGLHVQNVAANNLLLDATGSVAQVQQAFHTQINTYRNGSLSFYANASAPIIPQALAGLVSSINGLNDIAYQPLYSRADGEHTTGKAMPTGYGPSDILNAYDIARLQQAGMVGDNQSIALFELDGYQMSDVSQYLQYYNISPPTITTITIDGFNGAAGMGAVEDELDIELTAALAPHAHILVYEGPNTTQGINDIYSRIINDNKAKIVSVSWGQCEAASGNAEMQTLDTLFKQAAAQGISIFAAAGDSGAYDCRDTNLWVDSPASDPYVTAVGGTALQMNGSNYGSETAWSNPSAFTYGPKGAGGGGGLSQTFRQPSWQNGPGVQNQYTDGYRQVPDVSANAAFTPGYAVYCTVTNAGCPPTGWVNIGGTSGAAPVWAASMALVNQYLQASGKTAIGAANQTLYALASNQQLYPPFHDIISGNNLYYPATSGYDMATGLGSPDVYNIAQDLAQVSSPGVPPPVPSPSPTPGNGTIIAQDTFQRANQQLWGTASDGQQWGGDANALNAFSIINGQGQVANGNTTYSAVLGPSITDAQVLFTGMLSSFTPATANNIGAVLRWSDPNDWYKAYIDGANLVIQKRVNGVFTTLRAMPFIPSANTMYSIRFQVVGSTLSAKVWPANSAEPGNWMLTVTDNSLQSGSCGLRILVQNGAIATFTSFQATTAGA